MEKLEFQNKVIRIVTDNKNEKNGMRIISNKIGVVIDELFKQLKIK